MGWGPGPVVWLAWLVGVVALVALVGLAPLAGRRDFCVGDGWGLARSCSAHGTKVCQASLVGHACQRLSLAARDTTIMISTNNRRAPQNKNYKHHIPLPSHSHPRLTSTLRVDGGVPGHLLALSRSHIHCEDPTKSTNTHGYVSDLPISISPMSSTRMHTKYPRLTSSVH